MSSEPATERTPQREAEVEPGSAVDPGRLAQELAYFDYGEEDRALLAAIRPVVEEHADELVQAFYRHLLAFPETQGLLRDPAVTERLLGEQRRYLVSLCGPEIDEDYVRNRRRIGEVHEKVGLEPRWYIGAYALYLSLLTPILTEALVPDPVRAARTLTALQKLLLFDAQIAMGRYIDRQQRDLTYLNEQLGEATRTLSRDLQTTGDALRSTEARARAAERLASIGVLVAGLAHEIGTPMSVIQGHAKLLESDVNGDQAEWRLRTIQAQIGRITRIIESLLGMARPSPREPVPVVLGSLIENTIAFLGEKFARGRVEARLDLAEVSNVQGDPERIQQVLLNLFLNAADAMEEGGTLSVVLRESGDAVEVLVGDTGPGIRGTTLEEVFDPFVTTKEAGEGHGLGLAVAQSIVTEHGGRISIQRSDDEGTVFQILLPTATE